VLLPFTSPLVLSSLGAALAWWFRIYRPSFPGE
jgi:hypothetical protein